LAVTRATVIIQRYYRGWRVRRLLCMRKRSHRDFKKIEYNVRRLAFLLAKETESIFTHSEEFNSEEFLKEPYGQENKIPPIPPTIQPNPPNWALDLIKYILEAHPWLTNIYPHIQCASNHLRIQEFQGELPALKELSRCRFYKTLWFIPTGSECFLEIDLQVYPSRGIFLKIKNNDTKKSLPLINNRLFIGDLPKNDHGYTVQCYRWALPAMNLDLTDRAPSSAWKLRVITLPSQTPPVIQPFNDSKRNRSAGEQRKHRVPEEQDAEDDGDEELKEEEEQDDVEEATVV